MFRPKAKLQINDICVAAGSLNSLPVFKNANVNRHYSLNGNDKQSISHLTGMIDLESESNEKSENIAQVNIDNNNNATNLLNRKNCILAIANGDNGILFINLKGKIVEEFRLPNEPKSVVYGVKFVEIYAELKVIIKIKFIFV